MSYVASYLTEAQEIIRLLDVDQIERMVQLLRQCKNRGGRVFFLGVGGSAANASHAVNDFRKLLGFEAYTPTDNVSELTARINDDGWNSVFVNWLRGSRLNATDLLFIFSVGGGDIEKNISANLVYALQHSKEVGSTILGVVGRNGGFTAKVADACVVVPNVNSSTTTPHTEAFQAVIWHLLVSHPDLQVQQAKWESVIAVEEERHEIVRSES